MLTSPDTPDVSNNFAVWIECDDCVQRKSSVRPFLKEGLAVVQENAGCAVESCDDSAGPTAYPTAYKSPLTIENACRNIENSTSRNQQRTSAREERMRCRIRQSAYSPETNQPQSIFVRALLALVTLTVPGSLSEQNAAADEYIGSKPTLRVDTLPGIVTRDSWLCDFLSDERAGVNCLTHTTLQNTSIHDGPPVEVPEPLLFDLVHLWFFSRFTRLHDSNMN